MQGIAPDRKMVLSLHGPKFAAWGHTHCMGQISCMVSVVWSKTSMNGLSYNVWVYSKENTSENIQASGLVTFLRLKVTGAVLYNKFMHNNVTRWIVITYLIHPAKSFVPFFFHGSSWLIKVNDLFTLSYPHLFQIWYSKIYIMFLLTQCTIHECKTGNDVSEFTHSNWITLSYYSSPNTRVWFLNAWYNPLSLLYTVI